MNTAGPCRFADILSVTNWWNHSLGFLAVLLEFIIFSNFINRSSSLGTIDFTLQNVWLWVTESESPSVVSDYFWPHGLYSAWISPDQNTGVGSLFHFQCTFTSQGFSLILQVDSLPAVPQGKPKNTGVGRLSLLWRYSQHSNQPRVSCIARRFFTSCYQGSMDDWIHHYYNPLH